MVRTRLLLTKIAALPLVFVAVYHIVNDLPLTEKTSDAPVVAVTKCVPPMARELFAAVHGDATADADDVNTARDPMRATAITMR